MDTRIFASSLIALNQINADRRRPSSGARENTHDEWCTPTAMDGRVLRIASAIAAVWFGFALFGTWLL
jgi:hypothetical protein